LETNFGDFGGLG